MFAYLILCILILYSPAQIYGQVNCTSYVIPSPLTLASLLNFVDIRVVCGASHIEVRLNDCALSTLGLGSDNLILSESKNLEKSDKFKEINSDCYPYVGLSPKYNGFDTIFRVNVSDCAMSTFKNSSHVVYKHQIRTFEDPNNPQSRTKLNDDVSVEFNCVYETNLGSNLAMISSVYRRSRFSVEPILDNLEVAMAIFPDPTFTHAIMRNLTVKIPAEIYVGMTFSNGNADYLILQAKFCWLTPTQDRYGNINKTLLDSGCPVKSKTNDVTLYENFYSGQAKFSFSSFAWGSPYLSNQIAYVHCTVTACDSVLDDTCTKKNCLGQLEDNAYKQQQKEQTTETKTTTISIGPIIFDVSASICDLENGGCEHICSTTLNNDISCSCFSGYKLDRDEKSCHDLKARDFFYNISGDLGIPYVEMIVLFVAVGMLMIITFLICKFPFKRSKLESARQRQTL